MYLLTSIDPHTLVILTNMAWLAISIVLTFAFGKKYLGKDAALFAALFVASNPVLIYYASTGEIYSYDAAFSVFSALLLLSAQKKGLPLATFLLGAAGGFRLSSILLLMPFFVTICILRRKELFPSAKEVIFSIIGFLAGSCTWLIPVVLRHGGISNTASLLMNSTLIRVQAVQSAASFLTILFWMLNFTTIVLFFCFRDILKHIRERPNSVWITAAWILPPSIFFIMKHYAKGYALLLLPILAVIIAWGIYSFLSNGFRRTVSLVCIALNVLIFFFLPYHKLPVTSSRAREKRVLSERFQTQLLRAISVYGPSFKHLRTSDRSLVGTADTVLARTEPGSAILVDPTAEAWAYPRSLDVRAPDRYYFTPESGDTIKLLFYHDGDFRRGVPVEHLPDFRNVYLIADKRCDSSYTQNTGITPLASGEFTSLYRIPNDKLSLVWDFIVNEYYR